jgi:hypothetical protein
MSELNPNNTDAILGGQNPPPINAAVLGGDIGRKQRLQHEKEIARKNKFWRNFEYLDGLPHLYAATFADRQVVNFEPELEIVNPKETAYALRQGGRWWDITNSSDLSIEDKWDALLKKSRVNEIEALVFGNGIFDSNYVRLLVDNYQYFHSLKALFIGDIEDREQMISDLSFGCDISPVLSVHPDLEILHIRSGGRGNALSFSEWRHENLKALRIESSGLNRSAITSLCQLELPALEYLELWTGSEEYGSNSTIDDILPIISGDVFPHLRYLGVKNCEYTDDVAFRLAKSSLLEQLIELDLSKGTLTNDGFAYLAQTQSINELDVLNISETYVCFSSSFSPEELKIKPKVINSGGARYPSRGRCCVVRE